jgi:nicotinamide mononucleotide adenylyltransferase
VFAFGRFNPPTIGHQKLIDTVISTAEKANAKPYLFLSHKQNNKTDPLTFAEKQAYIQQYYPKLASGRCQLATPSSRHYRRYSQKAGPESS